jgi:fructose/tagatose bisphosphate aldolase
MSAAILIHNARDAQAAVAAAAALHVPVTLLSAPGAAGYAGAGYFRALIADVQARHPDVAVTGVLDCGAAPGHVMGALRAGITHLRFSGDDAIAAKLQAMAQAQGAALLTGDIAALDLARVEDADTACRTWLQRTSHG